MPDQVGHDVWMFVIAGLIIVIAGLFIVIAGLFIVIAGLTGNLKKGQRYGEGWIYVFYDEPIEQGSVCRSDQQP